MKSKIKGDWNSVKGMLREIFDSEKKTRENEEHEEKKSDQFDKPVNPNF